MDCEEKQRLNQEELKKFRKEKANGVCAMCGGKPFGITRTHLLCKKHYKRTCHINKKLMEAGIEITESFISE